MILIYANTIMMKKNIPCFAIIGHPNEGKSAVVSTLAEDDSVAVSSIPGETTKCRQYPVIIDGHEIISFIDTPGFQNPNKTLNFLKDYHGPDQNALQAFCHEHEKLAAFRDDCRLLTPVIQGAGIIFVVDGSRPVRRDDCVEMEILRLSGQPRMAIINCKENQNRYMQVWKNEFRKHFNAIRVFNAHQATYAGRIELLETLKSIDQDWQPALTTVITTFQQDWKNRCSLTAGIICELLSTSLQCHLTKNFTKRMDEQIVYNKLLHDYQHELKTIEQKAFSKIRGVFKHNIFNYDLPDQSILKADLFSAKTWQVLGLRPLQLAAVGGAAGSTMGAVLDVAAAGLTFGIFTILGGALGAGGAVLGGQRAVESKVSGLKIGGWQLKIGPYMKTDLLFILLDRSLLFCTHIINWAHGRRDYHSPKPDHRSLTTNFSTKEQKICQAFFKAVHSRDDDKLEQSKQKLSFLLISILEKISVSESRYGLIIDE